LIIIVKLISFKHIKYKINLINSYLLLYFKKRSLHSQYIHINLLARHYLNSILLKCKFIKSYILEILIPILNLINLKLFHLSPLLKIKLLPKSLKLNSHIINNMLYLHKLMHKVNYNHSNNIALEVHQQLII
jgi:hypothetical protein